MPFPCSEVPSGTNAINFARSLNEQNIAQMKKNNLRAYLVHFGNTLGPKVFITRSKQRFVTALKLHAEMIILTIYKPIIVSR